MTPRIACITRLVLVNDTGYEVPYTHLIEHKHFDSAQLTTTATRGIPGRMETWNATVLSDNNYQPGEVKGT